MQSDDIKPARCPVDGSPGRPVSTETVRALVRPDRVARPEECEWMFCKGPDCRIVYFIAGGTTIDKSALRVRVGLKEKSSPLPVCYCFGHTVESIREELDRTGRSTVLASVAAKVRAGECRCEVLNPEGICCLGDINRIVQDLEAGVEKNDTAQGAGNNPASGLAGAITAATLASICCLVPLALLGLGLGGAWMSSLTALEPFRPFFIAVTIAFLGFAFYRVYRRPASEACATGSSCENQRTGTLNKAILWSVTVLIGGLLAFPYIAPGLFAPVSAIDAAVGRTVVLTLERMHCPTCSITVRQALLQVPGVSDARVTLEPPEATIRYDPGIVSIEQLTAATEEIGFPSSEGGV